MKITDFYSFYDEGKNEYDFTVNLDKLVDWLKVQKGHLKTRTDNGDEVSELKLS